LAQAGFINSAGYWMFQSHFSSKTLTRKAGRTTLLRLANRYNLIVRDRGGKDIFVHASALNRGGLADLAEGQRVAVDMVEGGKGPEAVNIRLV
jgi:cold shock CspA family protein